MNTNKIALNTKLTPYYITGFSDGESSFIIRIRKNPKSKTG